MQQKGHRNQQYRQHNHRDSIRNAQNLDAKAATGQTQNELHHGHENIPPKVLGRRTTGLVEGPDAVEPEAGKSHRDKTDRHRHQVVQAEPLGQQHHDAQVQQQRQPANGREPDELQEPAERKAGNGKSHVGTKDTRTSAIQSAFELAICELIGYGPAMEFLTPDSSKSPPRTALDTARIAVLVPCHNEAATVGTVVKDFRRHLPMAQIHVYDNASTDDTAALARQAGAHVRHEPQRGKGNVVRRMLADVDADVYVLVDGDGTYDAASAPRLVEHLLDSGLDMVNGARIAETQSAFRPGHAFGNRFLTSLVSRVFGNRLRDMLSGYRVMSRRFVKSFPARSSGFEIETELTVHAQELRVPLAELPIPYRERPSGSTSKLHTVRDGMRIIRVILYLIKEERPLLFFTVGALTLAVVSISLGIPIIGTFVHTGLVPRLPTAILATGLMILAFLALVCGLILDSVTQGRRELKRLAYLAAGNLAPGSIRSGTR